MLEKGENHCREVEREVRSQKIVEKNLCPISEKLCPISGNGEKNDV